MVQLRDYQKSFAEEIIFKLNSRKRGVVSFPCGFGKTHILAYIQHHKKFNKSLIFCPTIDLLEQTGKKLSELLKVDILIVSSKLGKVPSSEEIEKFIDKNERCLVLSTYASKEIVCSVRRKFDCIFYDEAHRISKEFLREDFSNKLLCKNIASEYKIFLTATPTDVLVKHNEILSKCSLKHAIDIEALKEFHVVCFVSKEQENDCEIIKKSIQYLEKEGNKQCISFSSTNERAKKLSQFINSIEGVESRFVYDLNGLEEVNSFLTRNNNRLKVVANCRRLAEGIDIPSLDSIIFADANSSIIQITQGIGRAIRKNKNSKNKSLIVIPIMVNMHHDDFNIESPDSMSRYSKMLDIMKGLNKDTINLVSSNKGIITKSKSINIKRKKNLDINYLINKDKDFKTSTIKHFEINKIYKESESTKPVFLNYNSNEIMKRINNLIETKCECNGVKKLSWKTKNCNTCMGNLSEYINLIAVIPIMSQILRNKYVRFVPDAHSYVSKIVNNALNIKIDNRDEKKKFIENIFKKMKYKGLLYLYPIEDTKIREAIK